jgi:2-phosphoglycerate kinase
MRRGLSNQGGESADAAELRRRLRNVYWIGGGSGAGKSTIAGRLADRYGLHVYATDDVMPDHARRTTAAPSSLGESHPQAG